VSTAGTTNGAPYDLYLVGQAQLRRRAIAQSIESFQRAIDLDGNFLRAHAALAMALKLTPSFIGAPPGAPAERAVAEARCALALDSTLADAYVALRVAHGFAAQ